MSLNVHVIKTSKIITHRSMPTGNLLHFLMNIWLDWSCTQQEVIHWVPTRKNYGCRILETRVRAVTFRCIICLKETHWGISNDYSKVDFFERRPSYASAIKLEYSHFRYFPERGLPSTWYPTINRIYFSSSVKQIPRTELISPEKCRSGNGTVVAQAFYLGK